MTDELAVARKNRELRLSLAEALVMLQLYVNMIKTFNIVSPSLIDATEESIGEWRKLTKGTDNT